MFLNKSDKIFHTDNFKSWLRFYEHIVGFLISED